MSPLLEPPAARPHATDPAPCLNRCSINNACFSATHLPGGQIGKSRVDGRGREWVNESVWREDKKEGGWARTQTLEWLVGDGLATPEEAKGPVNLGMKCPPHPICSKEGQQKEYSAAFAPTCSSLFILGSCLTVNRNSQQHRWSRWAQKNRKKEKELCHKRDGLSCHPLINLDFRIININNKNLERYQEVKIWIQPFAAQVLVSVTDAHPKTVDVAIWLKSHSLL